MPRLYPLADIMGMRTSVIIVEVIPVTVAVVVAMTVMTVIVVMPVVMVSVVEMPVIGPPGIPV